jgi:hypothetical protein
MPETIPFWLVAVGGIGADAAAGKLGRGIERSLAIVPTVPVIDSGATGPKPVQLYAALKVEPEATVAAFDAQHPDAVGPRAQSGSPCMLESFY